MNVSFLKGTKMIAKMKVTYISDSLKLNYFPSLSTVFSKATPFIMAETIKLILLVISTIKERSELVNSNREKCLLLSRRINNLIEPLNLILKRDSPLEDNLLQPVQDLQRVINECSECIDKFGGNTFVSSIYNVARAASIEQTFVELHVKLSQIAQDLHINISVDAIENERAARIDNEAMMSMVYEMLEVNGQATEQLRSSVVLQSHVLMKKLEGMEHLIQRTNTLLALVGQDDDLCLQEASTTNTSMAQNIRSSVPSPPPKPDKKPVNSNVSFLSTTTVSITTSNFSPNYNSSGNRKLIEINMSNLQFNENDPLSSASVLSLVGKGSFASVYKVNYYDCEVVLKHFQLSNATAEDLRKIEREAMIMQTILHRNVVSFVGASLERGIILMEAATCSLYDVLHKHNSNLASILPMLFDLRTTNQSSAIKIMLEISRGLRYLHYHGILHRDIKSSNILLFANGSQFCAKIGDFGVASIVGMTIQSNTVSTISSSSEDANRNRNLDRERPVSHPRLVGSLPYMSPELFDFETDFTYTIAVDIYAFGITVNEILANERPWAGLHDAQIISKVVMKKQRPKLFTQVQHLREREVEYSKSFIETDAKFVEIINKCLDHDGGNRPTAKSLCKWFEAITITSTSAIATANGIVTPTMNAAVNLTDTFTSSESAEKMSILPIGDGLTVAVSGEMHTNADSVIYHHPGLYAYWLPEEEKIWQCCLRSYSQNEGCQSGPPAYHTQRFKESILGGSYLCCGKGRKSVGCQEGSPPPLFHTSMYAEWLKENPHFMCCKMEDEKSSGCRRDISPNHHYGRYEGKRWSCCQATPRTAKGAH